MLHIRSFTFLGIQSTSYFIIFILLLLVITNMNFTGTTLRTWSYIPSMLYVTQVDEIVTMNACDALRM